MSHVVNPQAWLLLSSRCISLDLETKEAHICKPSLRTKSIGSPIPEL
jgi:hypothetical protein